MSSRRVFVGGLSALVLAISFLGWVAAQDAENKTKKAAQKSEGEATAPRTSFQGRWYLVLTLPNAADLTITVLEIRGAGEKAEGELLTTNEQFEGAKLSEVKVKGNEISLKIAADNADFAFSGRLEKGQAKGEVLVGTGRAFPGQLQPTDAKNLRDRRGPIPVEGRAELVKAVQEEDFKGIQAWVKEHSSAPIAVFAYREGLGLMESAEVAPVVAARFADDYVKASAEWGPLLKTQAQLTAGTVFADSEKYRELALPHLDAALKSNADDSMKTEAATAKVKLLEGTGKSAEAVALADEVLAKSPFNSDLIYFLAKSAEKNDDLDRAIAMYGKISATPMLEPSLVNKLQRESESPLKPTQLPSAALERLWKKKHGDTEKLDEFVNSLYEQAIEATRPKEMPARAERTGNRVALFELFTGQTCPFCVAADVATTILEKTYTPEEVIVLRYHQHIPGPDPLANSDSTGRFQSYDGQGAPTLAVNGTLVNAGGLMDIARDRFLDLHERTTKILSEKTPVAIELSGKIEGRKVLISAKANAPEKAGDVRLRLALAEESIPFRARNGIRSHEMVVRSLPAGQDGVEARDGTLTYSGSVDIDELKKALAAEIKETEEATGAEFPAKPLDLSHFRIVAFVQDDRTGEVLQAKSVPVEGKLAASKDKE